MLRSHFPHNAEVPRFNSVYVYRCLFPSITIPHKHHVPILDPALCPPLASFPCLTDLLHQDNHLQDWFNQVSVWFRCLNLKDLWQVLRQLDQQGSAFATKSNPAILFYQLRIVWTCTNLSMLFNFNASWLFVLKDSCISMASIRFALL